jgi:hypothetical protein
MAGDRTLREFQFFSFYFFKRPTDQTARPTFTFDASKDAAWGKLIAIWGCSLTKLLYRVQTLQKPQNLAPKGYSPAR